MRFTVLACVLALAGASFDYTGKASLEDVTKRPRLHATLLPLLPQLPVSLECCLLLVQPFTLVTRMRSGATP
ncbi:hypothetical protein V5799_002249 [Amblyomma americanum]|uniref:Secreted protein n=1 Tax=Amblyomma americanum TaxID=6943 RepID=A0AAQ4CXV9_AMBAM